MSVSSSVNITELIDRCPLGPLQIGIIVLCALVALLDGFDLLAIGVAAPVMAGPLHIAPNQFGFVFSSALVGLMLGAFGLGPIADRYGRRRVLIYATATFGVFTLCTANAATLQQILLFRFLAGVGLGGSMPSFISLAAEYTPRSNRQAVIGLLWTGFPLGGVMVGLLASRQLFSAGMVGGTVLLWASYFVTFMMLVTSGAWTPTLLRRAGFDGVQSSVAMALFALGSVFGTPLAGFLLNRFAARRLLPAALVGGAATLGAVGHAIQSSAFVIVCLGFAGFRLGVASSGLIALAPLLYSTAIRSTGVGWAMGLGRLGSFVGPLAIGLLVNRGWQIGDCFATLEMTALCAALFTSVIGINRSCGAAKADRVTAATGEEL